MRSISVKNAPVVMPISWPKFCVTIGTRRSANVPLGLLQNSRFWLPVEVQLCVRTGKGERGGGLGEDVGPCKAWLLIATTNEHTQTDNTVLCHSLAGQKRYWHCLSSNSSITQGLLVDRQANRGFCVFKSGWGSGEKIVGGKYNTWENSWCICSRLVHF